MRTPTASHRQALATEFANCFKGAGVTIQDMLIIPSGVTVDVSTESDASKVADLLRQAGCRNVSFDADPDTDSLWFVVCDWPSQCQLRS